MTAANKVGVWYGDMKREDSKATEHFKVESQGLGRVYTPFVLNLPQTYQICHCVSSRTHCSDSGRGGEGSGSSPGREGGDVGGGLDRQGLGGGGWLVGAVGRAGGGRGEEGLQLPQSVSTLSCAAPTPPLLTTASATTHLRLRHRPPGRVPPQQPTTWAISASAAGLPGELRLCHRPPERVRLLRSRSS
uniref:Uncharacterized protein n=1 Tax=Oryza rufipogon TaxID=4529 RepID=A0A0E0PKT9_ORYRU